MEGALYIIQYSWWLVEDMADVYSVCHFVVISSRLWSWPMRQLKSFNLPRLLNTPAAHRPKIELEPPYVPYKLSSLCI